jgi:hypothetical protein
MTWRARFARWLLRKDADWIVVPCEHYVDYCRIIVEEEKLRAWLAQYPHLQPTFEVVRPSKRTRLH